jgi:hypothetical protein
MLGKSRILWLAVLSSLPLMTSATFGQLARPAAEYHSLLNMRFSEADGEFLIEGLQLVFPPAGDKLAVLYVYKSSGEQMVSLPLRFESRSNSPSFADLVPNAEPKGIKLRESGDFVLTIVIADDVVTRLPFTLTVKPQANAYDPPKKFLRDGPWRDLAYFSMAVDYATANLDFNWWMSLRELPIGMTNPLVAIHLVKDYREIARSRDPVALNNDDWQFFTSELIQITKTGPRRLTLADLAKRDGDYRLIVEANGKPIKSYSILVQGGRLQRAEQSRLDFEPHADFMSPRLLDTSARSESRDLKRDVYWVRRTAVTATFAPHADSKQPASALERNLERDRK